MSDKPTRTDLSRARRGAAWLDKKIGRGWRRKIRRRELAMESCQRCVLGQLYGDYGDGLEALGGEAADVKLGMDGTTPTEAWLEVLREDKR